MKVAPPRKKHLPTARRAHYVRAQIHHVAQEHTLLTPEEGTRHTVTFLDAMRRNANIQRKDFQYRLRVSQTTCDKWFSGELADPLTRARDVVALFREAGALWLVPALFEYIAGNEFTDVGILNAEQQKALMVLVLEAGKKKNDPV